MKKYAWLAIVLLACGLSGCDSLPGILLPDITSVRLVNTGDLDIEALMYIGDEQITLEPLLRETGEEIIRTIPAGQSITITRSCDDFQAFLLDQAELQVLLGSGPEVDWNLLRDGTHFNCGDEIVITFTYTSNPFDLNFDLEVDLR